MSGNLAASSERVIEATGLERHFGDVVAVAGIDLAVARGEVFGFLGPNGAGKSTTVRMLTTLLRPTGGSARIDGHDVVGAAAAVRRIIGVALQDAAIDPLMTGNELLRLQAVLHGIPRAVARTRGPELLERVGLTAAADRRVGTTVFLTTQYLEEADELAGRIAIIDDGRLVREGSPEALKSTVGSPTLRVDVDPADLDATSGVLAAFGPERPAREGRAAIGLEGGAARVAEVVRALDEAGVVVGHLELDAPSLDDVFADATGRRLEGAEE